MPISFTGKNKPLNNTANLYAASIKAQEESGDTFVKKAPPTKIPINTELKLNPQSEKICKDIVNAASLLCAGISAVSGKAEKFSPGAWALRGIQALMFVLISANIDITKKDMNLFITAALEYAATEYMSGAYLGCEGSKLAVAAVGTIADLATGGTSVPVSEGAVRGINSGISAAITRKMGNSFIKQIKNGSMKFSEQTIRLFSYLSGRLTSRVFADNSKLSDLTDISKIKDVFTTDYNANTISDLQDANKVKAILEATPEVYKELLAQIINHIMYRDIPNAVVLFMEQMAGIKINESILKHKLKKQYDTIK